MLNKELARKIQIKFFNKKYIKSINCIKYDFFPANTNILEKKIKKVNE
jgi:hypothetical protein